MGFPFVRLMVWAGGRGAVGEWVQGDGAGFKMGVSVVDGPPQKVFVTHLRGEELDKILLMTKRPE